MSYQPSPPEADQPSAEAISFQHRTSEKSNRDPKSGWEEVNPGILFG